MDDLAHLLRRLIEQHLDGVRTISARIRSQTFDMRRGGDGATLAAASAQGLAHQIAGAAGSIGFAEVSVVGRTLAQQLKPFAERGEAPGGEDLDLIQALVDRLDQVVLEQRPETSSLHNRGLALIQARGARREA